MNKSKMANICDSQQESEFQLTRSASLSLAGFKLWMNTCLLTGRRMSLARWLCDRLTSAPNCRAVVTRDATHCNKTYQS